jgi:hypothetical protein
MQCALQYFFSEILEFGMRNLVSYRLALPSYYPPAAAPEASYLQDLGGLGEWMHDRLEFATSDDMVHAALQSYRSAAWEIATKIEEIVKGYLIERYGETADAQKGQTAVKSVDLPLGLFLGFDSDVDWRSSVKDLFPAGYNSHDIRDVISVAGCLGLLDVKTVVSAHHGPQVVWRNAKEKGHIEECYTAKSTIALKSLSPVNVGTSSVSMCMPLISGSFFYEIKWATEDMSSFYASFGFLVRNTLQERRIYLFCGQRTKIRFGRVGTSIISKQK